MKLSLVSILALVAALPALALPEPVAASAAELPAPTFYAPVEIRELEKRDTAGVVKVDLLNYRTCPLTSCPAVGQYPKGTQITIECYTRDNTTVVNGDAGWAKVKEHDNRYWVALANGEYISWPGGIDYCPRESTDPGKPVGL